MENRLHGKSKVSNILRNFISIVHVWVCLHKNMYLFLKEYMYVSAYSPLKTDRHSDNNSIWQVI